MLRMLGEDRSALRVLRRLAKICPHFPGLQTQLRDLRDRTDEE